MTKTPDIHEDFDRRGPVERGTARSFGIVFAVLFLILALMPWAGTGPAGPGLLVLGGVMFLVSALRPALLEPLNRAWAMFGRLLHVVVTPLAMGLIFFCVVVPTGLAMRLAGKDPLRLRRDPDAKSLWIERRPPGPDGETMRNQY